MKINTRKYIRILDAESELQIKINKLPLYGSNWSKNRDKVEKLEEKIMNFGMKRDIIHTHITKEEFNEYLSDRMCCTWEDFKKI
jgi:methyl coenzyme M reductase subunit D